MEFIDYLKLKRLVPENRIKFFQACINSLVSYVGKEITDYSSIAQKDIDGLLLFLSKTKES